MRHHAPTLEGTRMTTTYQPPADIIAKYADLLINCALNGGTGIKPGETVLVRVPECAKPMLPALQQAVWRAGGNVITQYTPDGIARPFYEIANDTQLDFFPGTYLKGLVDQIDHLCVIIAETDKQELKGIDPQKVQRSQKAYKPWMDWRRDKEAAGKFSWTLAMWGTPQMAKEVNLTQEAYWDEIIKACYLDHENPVQKWRELMAETNRLKERLDALQIDQVRIEAPGTDLIIGIGEGRQWLGGTGRNIPSFEVFISPDWRRTQGHITFTEPLYRYGTLIKGVYAEFQDGRAVKVSAQEGEDVLRSMIAVEHADKLGEFSLTDGRMSRITKFMGETLFDENVGGRQGNTHVAFGNAYRDSYPGDAGTVPNEEWARLGYNESAVHTDIVATSPRTVTATLKDGTERVIYRHGQFLV